MLHNMRKYYDTKKRQFLSHTSKRESLPDILDFVLDSLGAQINPNLFEHIDGLNVKDEKFISQFKKSK